MSERIEWVQATDRPIGYTSADILEISEDGNERKDIGIRLGQSDGAMLYGQTREILTWLEQAVTEVRRVLAVEKAERTAQVKLEIGRALSRDDDTDYGSIFEDKVQVIRNLNADDLADAHAGKHDSLNMEYCRGQVELLMDTTDWLGNLRPDKEDVFFYVFGQDLV